MTNEDSKNKKRMPVGRRFKPGQSGCPNGRRGNRVPEPSSFDEMVLRAGEHRVDLPDGTTASLIELSLLQDAKKAAEGKNSGAAGRIQRQFAKSSAKVEQIVEELIRKKVEVQGWFDEAEARGLPPPDIVPHPAHWDVVQRKIVITGPETRSERAAWEGMKARMRWLNDALAWLKRMEREFGLHHPELKRAYRIDIERCRRKIPKGWDWKEKIYTLDSRPEELDRNLLREIERQERAGKVFDWDSSAVGALMRKRWADEDHVFDMEKTKELLRSGALQTSVNGSHPRPFAT